MRLLNYFPENYQPTDIQVDVLNRISTAVNSKKKFIVCAAPTGSGKSFIGKTIANVTDNHKESFKQFINQYNFNEECSNNGAFILTVTKKLQDQYNDFFSDIVSCKGKNNFKCSIDKHLTCDIGLCAGDISIKHECLSQDACPYYNQKRKAMLSKISTLNYEQFLSLELPLTKRDIIICDEASELEGKLVEYGTIKIDTNELKKLGIKIFSFPTVNTSYDWLQEIGVQINEYILKQKKKVGSLNQSELAKLALMQNLIEKIDLAIEAWNDSDYILTHEIHTTEWVFTPTYIRHHAKLIFDSANTIILMSATIIDHKTFANTLGIKDYEYIEVKSPFDPKKAPIYLSSKFKLNYSNLKSNLPYIVDFIKKICEHHSSERGIIHTHTQYIADFIKANYPTDRLLVRTEKVSNEQILDIHEQCKNSILVSPSLTHGVDLKGDLARFQIIVKTPWLLLGDERVKKLANIDRQWYVSKMFSTIIQSCGRGVRSVDDECVTYILDGAVIPLIHQYKSILPEYFIDRIQ